MTVLVKICVHFAVPDNLMQDSCDKVTVCGGRQISFLVRNIVIQYGICEFTCIMLCILTCAHTGAARSRADNVLHQSIGNIALHFADEHRILYVINVLTMQSKCLCILHEIVFIRGGAFLVTCLCPLNCNRAPIAVEDNTVTADERRSLIEIAPIGEVFRAKCIRHARHLLTHHDTLTITRLECRRIAGIHIERPCIMRGDEIIRRYNTIPHRNFLPAVRVDCCLFPLRIGREIGRILNGDHPRHDRLNLRRRPAARPHERLIDALKECTELREYGTKPLCRSFTMFEIHLEPTREAFMFPLTFEFFGCLCITLFKCGANISVQFGKLRNKRRTLVLLCLPLAPRRPLPDGLKLLCARLGHIRHALKVKEEEMSHFVKERRFIRLLKK